MSGTTGGPGDLTKGYVPIALIITFLVPSLLGVGIYFGKNDGSRETITTQITSLQTQMSGLATQVSQISIAVAKGPTLPENVAYKADLLRLCVENRQLKCPSY